MGGGEEFVGVNYYNPCQRLENDKIVRIKGIERHKIIWFETSMLITQCGEGIIQTRMGK